MNTRSVKNNEFPVVKCGRFQLLNAKEVLSYEPGRSIVLSGPHGDREVTAEKPLNFMALFVDGYTHYSIVDTTARHTVRNTEAHSSDPRYKFDLEVAMAAKVEDPIAFLRDFGSEASVFDAFYHELINDIARELADCPVENLIETQKRLSDYAVDIKRDQPFYKGVRIIQFNVTVKYDEKLRKKIDELDLRRELHERGEEYLTIDSALNPDHKERNSEIKAEFRESNEYHHDKNIKQARDAMMLAKQFAEMAGLEPRKVVQQAGLDDRVKQAIAPPQKQQAPDPALLFSHRNSIKDINTKGDVAKHKELGASSKSNNAKK